MDRPLIVDLDLDPGDILALSYLAHLPGYDLRAVTVAGTGAVHCPPGDELVRAVLDELGVSVPVACGSQTTIGPGHSFPDDWRTAADQLWGLRLATATRPERRTAAELLVDMLTASGAPVDVLQLGPATNLAKVLGERPDLRDRIHRVVMYGGAFDVSGGATGDPGRGSPEWSIWADPGAAAVVVGSGIPVVLVPLDAATEVPVPAGLVEELAADHAAGGADLLLEWVTTVPGFLAGSYFTGALAAALLEDPRVVDLNDLPIRIGSGTASELGRTLRDPAGTSVQVALVADPELFESVFMAGLRRGEPRAHPFTVAGQLSLTYDGARCKLAAVPAAPGAYALRLTADAGRSWVAAYVVLHAGHDWKEFVDFVATLDQQEENPTFADIFGFQPGTGSDPVVRIEGGTSGFACVDVADDGSLANVELSEPFVLPDEQTSGSARVR